MGRTPAARDTEGVSLTEAAVATIRDRILDLSLAPGSRIDEKLLIDRFGVSRTPAREALNRLVAEGLVEIRSNRGAFVRSLEIDDVARFFDAYYGVERLTAHLCRLGQPGLVEDLGRIQEQHGAAVADLEFLEVTRLNADFHLRIAAATENPYVVDFGARMHNLARRLAFFVYARESDEVEYLQSQQVRIVDEHVGIIERIDAHDRPGLMQAVTSHAQRFQHRVARFIGRDRGARFPPA